MKTEIVSKSNGFVFKMIWSICLGAFFGLAFHYLLYRLSLPTEPFIYAWF